ncbi:NUDIX domain-containing protein [Streptomyces koyangensis]|uniref:NUDIX domain-containing protein n=1 Tax=Streptomyces koyangensis TaxID=188770 RepID=UPI00364AE0BF
MRCSAATASGASCWGKSSSRLVRHAFWRHSNPVVETRKGAAISEETGVEVDPEHLRLVHVVHHKQDDETERIGLFFLATVWQGEPVNREPEKCLDLRWWSVHELPEDIIAYPEAGLLGYLKGGEQLTEHGWP